MANKKLQERKKQKRVRKVKDVVIKKREATLQERKKKKEADKLARLTRMKIRPIVKAEMNLSDQEKDDRIKSQLEHNLEILQALEDQYMEEQAQKEHVNKELEDAGAVTIKEKLDALEIKTKTWIEKNPQVEAYIGDDEQIEVVVESP